MIEIIDDHLSEIRALCVQWGARRLDLFGPAARGVFIPQRSDLDFFVEFHDVGWKGSFKRYMGLKLGLDLLGTDVDLVEMRAITNPRFLTVADRHRQILFAA